MESENSARAVNSAKRKQIEDVVDMGQHDDRLPGTFKMNSDVTMVPPIFMAGLRSGSHQTKRNDRTLTGATPEFDILS